MVVQRDAFAAFSDKNKFEQVKKVAAAEAGKIVESFREDAQRVSVSRSQTPIANEIKEIMDNEL